jgi:hypothetical protein
MRKTSSRTSLPTGLRPPTRPVRESHFQYNRKPARCHPTTVRGVTSISGFCHPDHNFRKRTPKQLVLGRESATRSLGVQSTQLLAKSEVLEDEIFVGAECTQNPAAEMAEWRKHGSHNTGTILGWLRCKLLIL